MSKAVVFIRPLYSEYRDVMGGSFLQEGQYLATLLQLQGVVPICLTVPSTRMMHATSPVTNSVNGKTHV